MRNSHIECRVPWVAVALLVFAPAVEGQSDIQSAVRAFLQAWYVDKASPEQLKSFVAKDNGFQSPPPASGPVTARRVDPMSQLFSGAFAPPKVGERPAPPPKTLSDAIEYPSAKNRTARTNPGDIVTNEFAIYNPKSLPKGSYLPTKKPASADPVATFLYHLTQAYPGKLYVVLYTVKGANMLQEAVVTYWIQENGAWKMAAFMGTDW